MCGSLWQCVAVCCSVLQCVSAQVTRHSVLQRVAVCCSAYCEHISRMLIFRIVVAVFCIVLQCVAVCMQCEERTTGMVCYACDKKAPCQCAAVC